MATVDITPGSWLNLTRLLQYKGLLFWDQTEYPDIPSSADDIFIQLNDNQAKRIDLVAYDYYEDPELMWVLLLANDKDLPNQFMVGEYIRIPPRETIDQLLDTGQ